jgi:hypothetical protein
MFKIIFEETAVVETRSKKEIFWKVKSYYYYYYLFIYLLQLGLHPVAVVLP